MLVVQVAGEVEDVALEQRGVGLLVERGAAPEGHGGREDRAVGPLEPAGVDAVGRQQDLARHGDVGRGEPELATPLVAVGDQASHLVRPAEHGVGPVEIAARAARCGSRWTRPGPPGRPAGRPAPTRSMPATANPCSLAELGQQGDVALALVAEVEVLADHDDPGAEAVDQHLGDEVLGRLVGRAPRRSARRRRSRRRSPPAARASGRGR